MSIEINGNIGIEYVKDTRTVNETYSELTV